MAPDFDLFGVYATADSLLCIWVLNFSIGLGFFVLEICRLGLGKLLVRSAEAFE